MNPDLLDRIQGTVIGAVIGDALGMPLEFRPQRPEDRLVREMLPGRLSAGSFTDDTEMALALAESLLAYRPINPVDLGSRWVDWYQREPEDIGNQTRHALQMLAKGRAWEEVAIELAGRNPNNAGNGSVMRCWPAALANWDNPDRLLEETALQSQLTHPQVDCIRGCQVVNLAIYHLLHGALPTQALGSAVEQVDLSPDFRELIQNAPLQDRSCLTNSGWVRHTLQSAAWGLLTSSSFEDILIKVVNLGNDADTAGAVVGALAGAAYGFSNIPPRWVDAIRGSWPLKSERILHSTDFLDLAHALAERGQLPDA